MIIPNVKSINETQDYVLFKENNNINYNGFDTYCTDVFLDRNNFLN